jgi:hypothetical protein
MASVTCKRAMCQTTASQNPNALTEKLHWIYQFALFLINISQPIHMVWISCGLLQACTDLRVNVDGDVVTPNVQVSDTVRAFHPWVLNVTRTRHQRMRLFTPEGGSWVWRRTGARGLPRDLPNSNSWATVVQRTLVSPNPTRLLYTHAAWNAFRGTRHPMR